MERKKNKFELLADKVTQWSGSSYAFGIATGLIIAWLFCDPIFKYSDTWQLVINTSTTIITFLMMFIIQKSQNKDSKAVQLKLNELIAASKDASNRIVDVEDLDEKEIDTIEDPRIEDQNDISLKVTSTAICGSDLHMYSGGMPQLKPMVKGHEFMGIIEDVGKNITD